MSDIAIRVENLGKAYRIGLKEQQHETMLGALAAWVKSPLKNFREVRNLSRFEDASLEDRRSKMEDGSLPSPNSQLPSATGGAPSPNSHLPSPTPAAPSPNSDLPFPSTPSDIIWALKDVSFEVKHGEAVGIIGRNGAGKSTLLKILSRITEPTRGRATVYGRVGSLLEVGTGFHPDLTGRENVYLNGTILGMKKREIDARFDEIVDFSGVEKFIDTPVKRYSSGMRVRLAFSVAAHLEPEILIVDEVLAVGDVAFQRKCLGKMSDVAKQGRTILFVSHNMAAIRNLCGTAVWLLDGRVEQLGEVSAIVRACLDEQAAAASEPRFAQFLDDPLFQLEGLKVRQDDQHDLQGLLTTRPITVEVLFTLPKEIEGLRIGFDLCTQDGEVIWRSFHDDVLVSEKRVRGPGHFKSLCVIPANLLADQTYELAFLAGIHNVRWITKGDVRLTLAIHNIDGVNSQYADSNRPGVLLPNLSWNTMHYGVASAEF